MPKNKIIIVGGVAGGATAAARLRRLDENSEIILFERGEHISFANCGLPYYIGDVIENRESLLMQTPEGIRQRYNIDVRIQNEVRGINREKKTIKIRNLKDNTVYTESYTHLILSPGAKPIKPSIPRINQCQNLFTLRNIPDTDKIKDFVSKQKPQKAVVIGGGFIGIEMVENLHNLGLEVTLVEMQDQVMTQFDFEMASTLHHHLVEKGVNLILSDGVKSFSNNGERINLQSGEKVESDLIILSIGVQPESSLARESSLETNERGGIIVNDYLQTSDPSIYAIGDAIQVSHYITGAPSMIPLAWPANRQGRIVADNIYGKKIAYKGSLGTSVAKVFDLTAASTGVNEKSLKKSGQPYKAIHIHPNCHAAYFPGATPIDLKVVFNPEDEKILGAQAIGYDGVEKRIDVIATAIKGNIRVSDLADLELSYAPPYSSAKDPVNMAGYVASNIIHEGYETIQWNEADEFVKQGGILVDVRNPEELILGKINGAINIPLDEMRNRLNEIPKEKEVAVYCAVGLRGYLAVKVLSHNGFLAKNLDGGYKTYNTVLEPQPSRLSVNFDDKGISINAENNMKNIKANVSIDCTGMQCPGPIGKLFTELKKLKDGETLKMTVTDPGFAKDVLSWCEKTGNTLLNINVDENKKTIAFIQKGTKTPSASTEVVSNKDKNVTLIAFSGELDKALATFIIANGAVAFGKQVNIFFTFWGLNILRKNAHLKVKKPLLDKMFGFMMPKGPKKLDLSKMNMMGLGPEMIKYVMKTKNVDSLESLIADALKSGVKLIACSMSMDIMGIKEEELIDGVEIGGVGTYLGEAEDSGVNLFI